MKAIERFRLAVVILGSITFGMWLNWISGKYPEETELEQRQRIDREWSQQVMVSKPKQIFLYRLDEKTYLYALKMTDSTLKNGAEVTLTGWLKPGIHTKQMVRLGDF